MKNVLFFVLIATLTSCTNEAVQTKNFDLVTYGIPLTVKAPVKATISQPSGEGEVWIEDETTNFYVQIRKDILSSADIATAKTEELEIVKTMDGFSKIILNEESGFIYETSFDKVFYDFKYIVIQGDSKYIFQKNFTKESTLEEVEEMYAIVKKR